MSLGDDERARLQEKLKRFREGDRVSEDTADSGIVYPRGVSRHPVGMDEGSSEPGHSSTHSWNPARIGLVVGLLLSLSVLSVYVVNHVQLQSPLNSVVQADPRTSGIAVSVRYGQYVWPSVLVYDLRSVAGDRSMADVFRVFLQFAHEMRSKEFAQVEVAFEGRTKFKLRGQYFQKLGLEYQHQNPAYTIRMFPQNVMNSDGSAAYGTWTGGLLAVLGRQMEDFGDFHQRWYLADIRKR